MFTKTFFLITFYKDNNDLFLDQLKLQKVDVQEVRMQQNILCQILSLWLSVFKPRTTEVLYYSLLTNGD
jgi:hypothetical protein